MLTHVHGSCALGSGHKGWFASCRCPACSAFPFVWSFQLFLTGVLGNGRAALAEADAMLSSLGEVQAVLDARVNVTGEQNRSACWWQ